MDQDLRDLVLRWHEEIFNQGRYETIDELMAPGAVIRGAGLGTKPARCVSDLKEEVAMLRAVFPDLRLTVDEIVCEGDMVAMRVTATGTHSGEGLGITPTGRRLEIHGMSMGRWQDGQLVEGWNQYDFLTLYRELGVLGLFAEPAPPGATASVAS